MAIFKCKMCGADLTIFENSSICECEYCGTKQTVPMVDDEKKLTLFNRANRLRLNNEFDKAAGVYESIVSEFPEEAESYWGLVLCKYGVEYVDDKKTAKKIPTCHRTLLVSVMDDDDFQQACKYADVISGSVYRIEAEAINQIQQKALEIARSEEPYDIFICYKESDDLTGVRTEDSLIAQDIYTKLIKDGYRVFFSRDSLRDVAGSDYEPYIYAALSSAKIMLAIGTKYECFDAVWVKNEWRRFISMMGNGSGKVLIPCFKNMDAYDMPKELRNMQALNMGEVTFFGDLSDNIERILRGSGVGASKGSIIFGGSSADVKPLLERGFLFLEDGKWQKADEFFEEVLNTDPKNGNAYLGKLLVDLEVSEVGNLKDFYTPFDDNANYTKIMRFGDDALKQNVKIQNDVIVRRNEENRKKDVYEKALAMMEIATTEELFENAGYLFLDIKDFSNAKDLAEKCFEKAGIAEKDGILNEAKKKMKADSFSGYRDAAELLEDISGWKDANAQLEVCKRRIEELRLQEAAERRELKRKEKEARKESERKAEEERRLVEEQKKKTTQKKIMQIILFLIVMVAVFIIMLLIIGEAAYIVTTAIGICCAVVFLLKRGRR